MILQNELLTQKLNKMDKEKILLDALNTFGNFTSVEQEFNQNQIEVIYEAMNQALLIARVVGRSEQLKAFIVDYINEFEQEGTTGWERYDTAKELIKSL